MKHAAKAMMTARFPGQLELHRAAHLTWTGIFGPRRLGKVHTSRKLAIEELLQAWHDLTNEPELGERKASRQLLRE